MRKIGGISNEMGYGAFIVGGVVRDLILGVRNLDLDIVIEGDAIRLAGALSRSLNGTLVVHKKFGTATLVTKDALKIDLATARKETYKDPAAFPTVEFSSLEDDLSRRDFTINAMAVSINKKDFGRLVDLFGGVDDLKRGLIRVMHDASFIDDPTRILRAVRFGYRLGFAIEKHTEKLIEKAMDENIFAKLSPRRIRKEMTLILKGIL